MIDRATKDYLYSVLTRDFEDIVWNMNEYLDPKYNDLAEAETYLVELECCVKAMRDVIGESEAKDYILEYNTIRNNVYNNYK